MAATIPELMEQAIAALESLAVTAEPIDDEQQYVRDLVLVWSARLRAVGADRATQAGTPEQDDAIAWIAARSRARLGPAPSDRLALDAAPGGAPGHRRIERVRFQDAAQDARAVVYAGIQADPLVATCAELLADATGASASSRGP